MQRSKFPRYFIHFVYYIYIILFIIFSFVFASCKIAAFVIRVGPLITSLYCCVINCVKSVQIQLFLVRIRKMRTKNNSVFGHFLRSDRETPLFLSKAFVTMNLLISFLTGSDFARYSMEYLFFRSKILTHGRAGSCFSFSNIIF